MLVGRESELDRLIRNLELGRHTLVAGARGTGKTALLRAAVARLPEPHGARLQAVYVGDCRSSRNLLGEAWACLGPNAPTAGRGLYRTTRTEGRLRVQDLRDFVVAAARGRKLCLLLDRLPRLHHRMRRVLEILEKHSTLACAVVARGRSYDLHFWEFDVIELENLPRESALEWTDVELSRMGYAGRLRSEIGHEVVRLTEGNPGALSRTLDVLRRQPGRLDDAIRVRRIFIDSLLES